MLNLDSIPVYNLEISNCKNFKIDNIKTLKNIRNLKIYNCPEFELKLNNDYIYKIKCENMIIEYKNIHYLKTIFDYKIKKNI